MLNCNCLRDVMLYLNKNLKHCDAIDSSEINLKYSEDDIDYCCKKLIEVNFIIAEINIEDTYEISDITMLGYDFINKVSDNKFWNKVLNTLTSVGKDITFALLMEAITSIKAVS